jgi:hypothetical protein
LRHPNLKIQKNSEYRKNIEDFALAIVHSAVKRKFLNEIDKEAALI